MLNEPVLIDTVAFAGLFDPRDQYHALAKAQFSELPLGKAYTCWPVITEAMHLIRNYPAQQDRLLARLDAGDYSLLPIGEEDIRAIREVMQNYRDQQVDLADAVLVHLANRDGIDAIFTFDRRHFSVYRRNDGRPFRLLPDPL
jgi:uncharacterized protein